MTDFSSVRNPSGNLSHVLRKGGPKASIDDLESNLIAEIKRKARGRERLTSKERQLLNRYNSCQISTAFDEAKEKVIEETQIELWDDAEVKTELVEEVAGFTETLAEFTIEKVAEITSELRNTVTDIGRGIGSFFTNMWSWITGW